MDVVPERHNDHRIDRRSFLLGLAATIPGLACGSIHRNRAQGQARQIRVLSYNIHHGEGMDGRLDLGRIADVIASARPDVVALQEVDVGTQRSGGVDQAEDLSRRTGMQVVFGGNLEYEGGLYGNAVLSRLPILEHRNHALPNPTGTEPRGVLEVRFSAGEGADEIPLTLLATHLDNRAEENRLASAKWVEAFVRERQDAPLLLAGDLNSAPGDAVMGVMARSWSHTGQAPMPTVPVERPVRQIDYVMYRPAGRWRPVEARVLKEPVASDHLPILAVLEFVPNRGSVARVAGRRPLPVSDRRSS